MHWPVIYLISKWGNILASLNWWRKPLCGAAHSGVGGCSPVFTVLAEFNSSCLSVWTTRKEVSSMGKEREWWNLSAFHGQQREIGTFMTWFASYQNAWIKQFICLPPSIDSEIRLWLTLNTCNACISLRSSQVRWIQSAIFSLPYGL